MKRLSLAHLAGMASLGLLAGCGSANQQEFVQACLRSSTGAVTEEICECAARSASKTLSSKQFNAMVLDMQGKKREAEQSLGDLSFDDRTAFAIKQFEIVGQCAGGDPG